MEINPFDVVAILEDQRALHHDLVHAA